MSRKQPSRYWLVKQEPDGEDGYPFAQLQRDKRTAWTGVRNYQARNNLRAMSPGDLVFYYHSNAEKAIVGLARVTQPAFPDPTAPGEDWSAVELEAVRTLPRPLPLAELKKHPKLKSMAFVRQSRLSVSPVTTDEAAAILAL